MLKSLIIRIVYLLGRIFSYDRIYWTHQKWNSLYSLWICNFIGSVGINSKVFYPCRLWGGGHNRIMIGNNTTIQGHCILGCWTKYAGDFFLPSIIIGNDCNIGEYCHISAINKITIGDGLLTGRFVYIGDNAHGGMSWEEADIPPAKRKLKTKGEIMIGRNVWIGDKSTILGGVSIGDNVIIGANTVVTHDIPSNTVVGGVLSGRSRGSEVLRRETEPMLLAA